MNTGHWHAPQWTLIVSWTSLTALPLISRALGRTMRDAWLTELACRTFNGLFLLIVLIWGGFFA